MDAYQFGFRGGTGHQHKVRAGFQALSKEGREEPPDSFDRRPSGTVAHGN